ncbi:MAG: glycosyltransferase family 39 protein [Paracoccus sp. (in: a-proteobacteria)]|uniref:glycosyltransferase family 39 protein n=1 Tax=Paracoccus sp. TaxID=267 RepID=UPI0030016DBF
MAEAAPAHPARAMPRGALAVLAAGMALRLIWALLIPVDPVSDSAAYETFAWTLVNDGVYGWSADQPSAYWAVGTSAIAAATFLLLGQSYAGIVALNLLAALVAMIATWRLGQIYYGGRAAFAALAVMAFWPNLIFFTSILSSELYFIALVVTGWYFWARPAGRPWVNLILAGLIWGLACYVRPVILLLPAAFAIAALSRGMAATLRSTIRAALVIALIVLSVSPWTLRNAREIGKPFLVSSNFNANLWMGNNPDSQGGYTPLPAEVSGMDEARRDAYLGAQAREYIRSDPLRFAADVGRRVLLLHSRETIGVAWNRQAVETRFGAKAVPAAKLVATGYWYLVLAAALAGVALSVRQAGLAGLFHPVFGGWAYFTAVHAIIVAEDRYHMPATPFMTLLAGLAIAGALRRHAGPRHPAPAPAGRKPSGP